MHESGRNRSVILVAIAKELLNILENTNEKVVTYSELSRRLGGFPYQRNFKPYLIDLSNICIENNLPLISAIVIRKGKNVAGDGFVNTFFDYIKTVEEKKSKYIEELNKVKMCNDWSKLKKVLNII